MCFWDIFVENVCIRELFVVRIVEAGRRISLSENQLLHFSEQKQKDEF